MDIDCDVIDVDLWSPTRGTYPSSANVLDKCLQVQVHEMNSARNVIRAYVKVMVKAIDYTMMSM